MKFGFDIDGTITAAPEPLREIMAALRGAGHEVHVITGQTRFVMPSDYTKRAAQLEQYGVLPEHYDTLHIAGPPDWVADKQSYCRANGICFMFEDSIPYATAISQVCPTTVMWEKP